MHGQCYAAATRYHLCPVQNGETVKQRKDNVHYGTKCASTVDGRTNHPTRQNKAADKDIWNVLISFSVLSCLVVGAPAHGGRTNCCIMYMSLSRRAACMPRCREWHASVCDYNNHASRWKTQTRTLRSRAQELRLHIVRPMGTDYV